MDFQKHIYTSNRGSTLSDDSTTSTKNNNHDVLFVKRSQNLHILHLGPVSCKAHEDSAPDLCKKDWYPTIAIKAIAGNKVKELTDGQDNEPWDTQQDGGDTVVYGKRVEGAKLGVEGQETTLLFDEL